MKTEKTRKAIMKEEKIMMVYCVGDTCFATVLLGASPKLPLLETGSEKFVCHLDKSPIFLFFFTLRNSQKFYDAAALSILFPMTARVFFSLKFTCFFKLQKNNRNHIYKSYFYKISIDFLAKRICIY